MCVAYLRAYPARHAATAPSATEPMSLRRFREAAPGFMALGIPGAVMLGIEASAFEVTTILSGYLGTVELDAHIVMLQIATLTFFALPFAVSIAVSIR